jgi:hypothetical protein
MYISNFGSFGNMHIRNSLFGYPKRRGQPGHFPAFTAMILVVAVFVFLKGMAAPASIDPSRTQNEQDSAAFRRIIDPQNHQHTWSNR